MQTLFNPPTRLPTLVIVGGTISTPAGVDLTLIPGAGGITIIGDAGSPGHLGTPTNDDFYVSGRLEVDGFAFFDGDITIADDIGLHLGDGDDARFEYSTAQTADALMLGLSADSRNLVICEKADIATDFAHVLQANPTVFVHSADATDVGEFVGLSYLGLVCGTMATDKASYDFTIKGSNAFGGATPPNDDGGHVILEGGDLDTAGEDGIVQIGSGFATSHALVDKSDLGIAGKLEVDGYAYFDSVSFFAGTNIITGANQYGGGSVNDSIIKGDNTNDQWLFAAGSLQGRQIVITEATNFASDHDHATTTNPTVFIHSATDPDSDNTEWISLTHDQTRAVIDSGKGGLRLNTDVEFQGDVHHHRHYFEDQFLWTSGIYGTVWDLTTTVGAGTNAMKAGAGMGGVALLTTGGATGDLESTVSQDVYFSRVIQPSIDAHVLLDTDLAGKEVFFGLSDTPMGAGTDYVFFLFDYSNDNVNWWHSSSGGTDASLAVGPTAGTAQELKIKLDSAGQARFYVDDVLVATVAGAVANDHGDMYLFYGVKTEANQAEAIEVDHLTAQWD